VAAILHDPVDTSIVTTPVFAFTEHTDGEVVAKTTPPVPLPPATPKVTVLENPSCAGALVIENALWFVIHFACKVPLDVGEY
jgi:hypothetical protein